MFAISCYTSRFCWCLSYFRCPTKNPASPGSSNQTRFPRTVKAARWLGPGCLSFMLSCRLSLNWNFEFYLDLSNLHFARCRFDIKRYLQLRKLKSWLLPWFVWNCSLYLNMWPRHYRCLFLHWCLLIGSTKFWKAKWHLLQIRINNRVGFNLEWLLSHLNRIKWRINSLCRILLFKRLRCLVWSNEFGLISKIWCPIMCLLCLHRLFKYLLKSTILIYQNNINFFIFIFPLYFYCTHFNGLYPLQFSTI
jgi:hypothetical protein